MKNLSAPLLAWLAANDDYLVAELYTITLLNGQVLYWTSADRAVVYGGHTFLASSESGAPGQRVTRGKISVKLGVDVSEMELDVAYDQNTLYASATMPQLLLRGDFMGATVNLDRAYMSAWGTVVGVSNQFLGSVGTIDGVSSTGCKMTVRSKLELLNINLPKNLIQPGCGWTLFDSGCTLNRASFAISSVADTGSTAQKVIASGLAQADSYFSMGTISFTSGNNAGSVRTVKLYTVGIVIPTFPLLFAPAAGDAFTIYPGCDKQQATCSAKFSNLVNFRGFPYVPAPETAI